MCVRRVSLYGRAMEKKYHDQQFEDALTVIQGLSDPGGTVCRILRESSAAAAADMSGYVSRLLVVRTNTGYWYFEARIQI